METGFTLRRIYSKDPPVGPPLPVTTDVRRDDGHGDSRQDDKIFTQKDVILVIEQLKRSNQSHDEKDEDVDDALGNEDDAVQSIYDSIHAVDHAGQQGSTFGEDIKCDVIK